MQSVLPSTVLSGPEQDGRASRLLLSITGNTVTGARPFRDTIAQEAGRPVLESLHNLDRA